MTGSIDVDSQTIAPEIIACAVKTGHFRGILVPIVRLKQILSGVPKLGALRVRATFESEGLVPSLSG